MLIMEGLRPTYASVIDLGLLDIPNRREEGSAIILPTVLVAISEYDQRDQMLLAGLTGEGGYATGVAYSFSSRLGSMDHTARFIPVETGYEGTLQIKQTVDHIYKLDTPKSVGGIEGVLPFGRYHVNDYFRGKPSIYAVEFRLTPEGLYIPQQGGEVKIEEQNQDQMDLAIILLSAAYTQSVLERIKPAFYTTPHSYPHMELPAALEQFNHGCFLRLHKDKII